MKNILDQPLYKCLNNSLYNNLSNCVRFKIDKKVYEYIYNMILVPINRDLWNTMHDNVLRQMLEEVK